jgi:hypothetical protein
LHDEILALCHLMISLYDQYWLVSTFMASADLKQVWNTFSEVWVSIALIPLHRICWLRRWFLWTVSNSVGLLVGFWCPKGFSLWAGKSTHRCDCGLNPEVSEWGSSVLPRDHQVLLSPLLSLASFYPVLDIRLLLFFGSLIYFNISLLGWVNHQVLHNIKCVKRHLSQNIEKYCYIT